MLFTREVLDGIAEGRVNCAFRRWDRPWVRPGSRLRTAVGVLAIDAVEEVDPADITEAAARQAGYGSRHELVGTLCTNTDRSIYRISLRLAGPDPRLQLREQVDLSDEELAAVRARLARLDSASRRGPWAATVLRLVADAPGIRAADLAAQVGRETRGFKTDVRKLKELGLTESLEVGYRLSPRGQVVLEHLTPGHRS